MQRGAGGHECGGGDNVTTPGCNKAGAWLEPGAVSRDSQERASGQTGELFRLLNQQGLAIGGMRR